MNYWILKSEPTAYSFDDLIKDGHTMWNGVRNYQARNNLKSMKTGDMCLIYHSVGPKEIVGSASVIKEAYPDPTTADLNWVAVDIKFDKKLKTPVTLQQLKNHHKLNDLSLVKQSRLSVCPIRKSDWDIIQQLGI